MHVFWYGYIKPKSQDKANYETWRAIAAVAIMTAFMLNMLRTVHIMI